MCMENSMADHVVGQVGILVRAVIVGGVGYGVWVIVSGSAFDIVTHAGIAGVLWALTNAVFWLVKMYRPDILDTAKAAEREL